MNHAVATTACLCNINEHMLITTLANAKRFERSIGRPSAMRGVRGAGASLLLLAAACPPLPLEALLGERERSRASWLVGALPLR